MRAGSPRLPAYRLDSSTVNDLPLVKATPPPGTKSFRCAVTMTSSIAVTDSEIFRSRNNSFPVPNKTFSTIRVLNPIQLATTEILPTGTSFMLKFPSESLELPSCIPLLFTSIVTPGRGAFVISSRMEPRIVCVRTMLIFLIRRVYL